MRVVLTDRLVAGTKPDGKQTEYFDTKATGLSLRINQAGGRSWYWHFTGTDRRRGRMLLGTYPAMSLAAARGAAVEARGLLESGLDPRMRKHGGMTVATLVDAYLAKRVRPTLRGAVQVERRLNKNVVPIIGGVRLGDLHRRDVTRVVDTLMDRDCPAEATRVLSDLRAMLRWAVKRGDLDRDPAAGMDRPAPSQPRDRVLAEAEIEQLWRALPTALPIDTQRIVRLCLITGQRVGEVSGMTRLELDLSARDWKLPGSRTKNKQPHKVPLSDLALVQIDAALADAGDRQRLFMVEAAAVTKQVAHAKLGIEHFTPHDLRRTALDAMATLGVAPHVVAAVANHVGTTKATVTTRHYVQYSYDREKREALELWADRLTASPTFNIPMSNGRR
jgi:integrase